MGRGGSYHSFFICARGSESRVGRASGPNKQRNPTRKEHEETKGGWEEG